MKKGKSSKRKPKRLKMGTTSIVLLLVVLTLLDFSSGANIPENKESHLLPRNHNKTRELNAKDSRGLFSPRMDYEQWKPLGRGDPLQNDPTYDYVPPVLERVHYWVEPPTRKQDGPSQHEGKKSEILVLGVSSKKPSTSSSPAENRRDSYESFLKFIDGPKFQHHNHNSFIRPNSVQRPPQPPHGFHSQFYKNIFDDGHYKADDQRMPYTVLVPPPIPPPHMEMPNFKLNPQPQQQQQPATQRPVYTPSTTVKPQSTISLQESNLIYHSSSIAGNNQWQNGGNQFAHGASSQYITWKAPTDNPRNQIKFKESDNNNNRIVFTKNASDPLNFQRQERPFNSPIAFPTEPGRIVFEQHSSFDPSSIKSAATAQKPVMVGQTALSPNMVLEQAPLILAPTGNPTLHVLRVTGSQPTVTQMSVGNQPMHKGQVSDDTIGNTYVNIGKPNAHIQKEITTDIPYMANVGPFVTESVFNKQNNAGTVKKPSLQMPHLPSVYPSNQINSVYINEPITNKNKPLINGGQPFTRRPTPITDNLTMQTMQTLQPPPMSPTTQKTKTTKKPTGFLHLILQKETSTESTIYTPSLSYTSVSSTTPMPTTTAVSSLTTDPLFKHYKQPAEPLRGPMYLIIQGHSKVKTYGASNKEIMRDFSMPENNEIQQMDKYPVKHLHNHKEKYTPNSKEEISHSRAKSSRTLKDLVNKGIGKIDIKETELGVGYEVSDTKSPSEIYHKGIVESEENELNRMNKLKDIAKVREKRQLEDFIPVVEDTVETFIYDYLKRQSEGSGVGAIIASAITNDSSEDNDLNELDEDDDEEE